jgi:hypothetical protein
MVRISEKQLRKILREHKFFMYLCVFFCIVSIFLLYVLTISPLIKYNPKIKFQNMTQEQISDAQKLIDNLKPIYGSSSRSITFTGNRKDLDKWYVQKGAGGWNSNKQIMIYWSKDMEWNEMALCHEISHNFLPKLREDYAYDLMEYKFCYR